MTQRNRNQMIDENQSDNESVTLSNPNELYVVEKILDKKVQRGQNFYLIKWVGFEKKSDRTWEPEKNLTFVDYMVSEYNQKNKDKPNANNINGKKGKTKNITNNKNRNENSNNKNAIYESEDDNEMDVEQDKDSFQLKKHPKETKKSEIFNKMAQIMRNKNGSTLRSGKKKQEVPKSILKQANAQYKVKKITGHKFLAHNFVTYDVILQNNQKKLATKKDQWAKDAIIAYLQNITKNITSSAVQNNVNSYKAIDTYAKQYKNKGQKQNSEEQIDNSKKKDLKIEQDTDIMPQLKNFKKTKDKIQASQSSKQNIKLKELLQSKLTKKQENHPKKQTALWESESEH